MNCKPLSPFGVEITVDISAKQIRELVLEHSLVLIRNFSAATSDSELIDFAAEMSATDGTLKEKLLHWDFGPLMHMKLNPEAENYLFSADEVPYHWDGAFHVEPECLLFHCDESQGQGGETLFCHTPSVLREFSKQDLKEMEKIQLNYQTEKLAHYGGQISVPMLQKHPKSHSDILRFAEEVKSDLNPVSLRVDSDPKNYFAEILKQVKSSKHTYSHRWMSGDLIVADNFSLIHGRRALGSNTSRQFRRLQII